MFLLFSSVFSMGKKDTEEQTANQTDSWTNTFDLEGRKAGKYNILVTAVDTGANQTLAGPYNIFIDPESDLPNVGITNPYSNMVVNGNLNIVGTCADDDAVKSVWLVFDGDSENAIQAEGTDFWSFYLNTKDLAEGSHTITVYGYDINDLKGKEKTITWILNRNAPQTALSNPMMGTLVSGKQKLTGTIADGNGIKDLSYSIDKGQTFNQLKISTNKKTNETSFEFVLDTKKLSDGPQVLWFKGHDSINTQGMYAFLLFVDNTNPEVKIVSPAKDEVVNGKFTVAGYAKDTSNISSVSWSYGNNKGTIELIPGNPFFSFDCDVGGIKDKGVNISVTATDKANNTISFSQKQSVNSELDKPVVTLFTPKEKEAVDEVWLQGIAKDDDKVANVYYQIDNGEKKSIATDGVFSVNILAENSELSFGAHAVTVYADDVNGIVGNAVKASFVYKGKMPAFEEAHVVAAAEPDSFAPTEKNRLYSSFMEVNPESSSVLTTSVFAACGISKITYQFSGADAVENSLKKPAATVAVNVALPENCWGFKTLNVIAEDVYGRTSQNQYEFFFTNLGIERGADSFESADVVDETGVVTFGSVGEEPYTSGMKVVVPAANSKNAAPVFTIHVASSSGTPAVSYTINNGASKKAVVKKTEDKTQFDVEISLAGCAARFTEIKIDTVCGKEAAVSTTAHVFVIRDSALATVEDNSTFYWMPSVEKDSYILGSNESIYSCANFADPVTAEVVSGTNSASSALSVEVAGKILKITPVQEGVYKDVVISVADGNGKNHQYKLNSIIADYEAPEVTIESPVNAAWLKNELTISCSVKDALPNVKTEYALISMEEGFRVDWKEMNSSVKVPLDFQEDGPVVFAVRATDASGKQTVQKGIVYKDTTKPEIATVIPAEGFVVNGETLVVLSVKDNGYVKSGSYVAADGKEIPVEVNKLVPVVVGTEEKAISNSMKFRFTDESGNVSEKKSWEFKIDAESDKPVAEINVPEENEVIIKDFVVSGVVYDDDGDCSVSYKIDNGNYITLEGKNAGFSIPIALSSLTDNEHTVTIQAEDLHGVKSAEAVRKFRVSLEEPKASFVTPSVSETVKDIITITGVASDKNGIDRVELSLDNGNSYVPTVGTENWKFTFDSHVIEDGTHSVFLRVYDKYGIQGMYSSILNTDNTAPSLILELPRDGSKSSGVVFFSGHAMDNVDLKKLYCTVRGLSSKSPEKKQDIEIADIISGSIDMSEMPDGFYNIEITSEDSGGNITRASRNIELGKSFDNARVRILYPMDGETRNGTFNMYGQVETSNEVNKLVLIVDGKETETAALTSTGYFRFDFSSEIITAGEHSVYVRADLVGAPAVKSLEQKLNYSASGPWVTVNNFTMGDFSFQRAYLEGNAGYTLSDEDIEILANKESTKEQKEAVKAKTIDSVELSFDNGRTFEKVKGSGAWKYRMEDSYMHEGYHFMIIRANFKNGETAFSRFIIQIDKTAPSIKLISPGEGGRYNQQLTFSGLASDNVHLEDVKFALRSGDKSMYSVPGFIQGLYFDVHALGASLYDVGAGLSFFDDNVKLQVQYGQMTDSMYALVSSNEKRYGGNVIGAKLIANLYSLPFKTFLGPDWEWLSATFALGADFSLFSETQSENPQMLSAVLAQMEFPRVTIPKWKYFRTWAFYSEFQLWFAPSDRNSDTVSIKTFIPMGCVGVRAYVF